MLPNIKYPVSRSSGTTGAGAKYRHRALKNAINNPFRQRTMEGTEEKDKGIWLVARSNNEKVYYVCDVEKDTKKIMWAPSRSNAMIFHTQAGVTEFLEQFMKGRDGVYLVHTMKGTK